MLLIDVNHVITEIVALLEGIPETTLLTDPVKKDLVLLLVDMRLKNEVIETVI